MESIKSEITVVGAGAAGLWAAKKFIDEGHQVTVIEGDRFLAPGASTRNEGWLHAGTYHAVGIKDEGDAAKVVERTLYGHEATVSFAPETINESRSICFTQSEEMAEEAVRRWEAFNVTYREVSTGVLDEEDIASQGIAAAFEVADKSVNTHALYKKIANYILKHGGSIISGTPFQAVGGNEGRITLNGTPMTVEAEKFIVTAGGGIREMSEALTGVPLQMRFYKAHLLVGPQLAEKNYFSLDVGEAGIMNHQGVSVIGINRDGIQLDAPDYEVSEVKASLLREVLGRTAFRYADPELLNGMATVACCKPDVYAQRDDIQSLNAQLFPLTDNYIGALPGKMTETPYLAQLIWKHVESSGNVTPLAERLDVASPRQDIQVAWRPADHWMGVVEDA